MTILDKFYISLALSLSLSLTGVRILASIQHACTPLIHQSETERKRETEKEGGRERESTPAPLQT
jgi:hypothetical protein